MKGRTAGITSASYKQEIARLKSAILDCPSTTALYAEGIGNLLREFGEAGAEEWFKRALELHRQAHGEPAFRLALLYWKKGDVAGTTRECKVVLETFLPRVGSGKGSMADQQLWRAHLEVTCAYFITAAYREALNAAIEGIKAGGENNQPYILHAIREMARGLLERDPGMFHAGLSVLEGHLRQWPTPSSSLHEDLYRFCLPLRAATFPNITAEKPGLH
jgi:hypothetical protein